MSRTVNRSVGRWLLMFLVLGGAILTMVVLFYKGAGGAIHNDAKATAFKQLIEIYLPLVTIMGAFFFSEPRSRRAKASDPSLQTLVFAAVLTASWTITPPALLYFTDYIEDFFQYLESVKLLGEAVAAGAVSFYFAK